MEEGDRVLASWALGELDAREALVRICAGIERYDTACGAVVEHTGRTEVIAGERGASEGRLLTHVATRIGNVRALHTSKDARWRELCGRPSAAAPYRWLVAEPALVDGEGVASLLVLGQGEALRDEVLVALPRLARACGAVLALELHERTVAETTHATRNLLASLLANGEYVFSLLTESDVGELDEEPSSRREQIVEAMRNVLTASERLRDQLKTLSRSSLARAR